MNASLDELIARAKGATMNDAQREAQRRSFAYGSANIENSAITRDTVRQASEQIARQGTQIVKLDAAMMAKRV